jgi:hypothetical protein
MFFDSGPKRCGLNLSRLYDLVLEDYVLSENNNGRDAGSEVMAVRSCGINDSNCMFLAEFEGLLQLTA